MRIHMLIILITFALTTSIHGDTSINNVLNEWEVVLSNADGVLLEGDGHLGNCFVALKNASRKKQPWCDDLNSLFDKMFYATISNNADVYKQCFDKKSIDDVKIKSEMANWRGFNNAWAIRKCAWFKKKLGRAIFAIVIASTEEKRFNRSPFNKISGKDYHSMSLRRILYALKEDGKYKFARWLKDKQLNELAKNEIFTSLETYDFRPQDEIKLRKKLLMEKKKKLTNLRLAKNYVSFFTNDEKVRFKKKGYTEKDVFKLYIDLSKRNNASGLQLYTNQPDAHKRLKYGIKLGHVKIFEKPVVFHEIGGKPKRSNSITMLDIIRQRLYKVFGKFNKKRNITDFQLMAYEKKSFRDEIYFDFLGAEYAPEGDGKWVVLGLYEGYIYDRERQCWRKLRRTKYTGDFGNEKKLHDAEEKYDLYRHLRGYCRPLEQVITFPKDFGLPAMKKDVYIELLKRKNLYEIFRIRKVKECTPYKPGLDFLKLPTVDPKKYNFPELAETLSGN